MLQRDPEVFAGYVIDLYEKGGAKIGAVELERCAMLGALFPNEEVVGTAFPSSVRTIFE